MFRTQQNVFDEAVAKATDENLTSENWEYILDVCDKVSAEDSGGKDAVAAMIKRLAHRNANVQLYTLELANAVSQNCGRKIHQELASRSLTDALLRLAGDRNTHTQVKAKILERMGEWSEMFSKDPDLGIMEQAYMRLKTQNPNLHPPSKPTKRQITDVDRQKEEDELQMALALSVKDKTPQPTAANSNQGSSSKAPAQAAPSHPVSQGTTAATVSRVRALFDFQPSEPGELQFKKGDVIAVLESVYKDWWKGSLRGQMGIFPLNYVEKLADPTQEEVQREAQMEAEVFSEIKNVEKLLTLLSTVNSEVNVKDNEEITTLYHSTLAIRPKLIELIGKYSQKKDDFTQLNERYIKARRDYESLLEASMSQPQAPYGRQPQYGYPGPSYSQQGPPPQQDPGRYYTPNPQDARTPQPQAIPQNGPAPFYLSNQAQAQYPPRQNATPLSSSRPQPPQVASDPYTTLQPQNPPSIRPQSTYDQPQELSSNQNFSPPANRPLSYPPQFAPQQQQQRQQPPPSEAPPQTNYASAPYPADDGPPQGHAPYPSAQAQPAYQRVPVGGGGSVQQQPPPPQSVSPGPGNPYPVLGQGAPAPKPQYQAYQPLKQAGAQQGYGVGAGGSGAGAAGDPGDYYR